MARRMGSVGDNALLTRENTDWPRDRKNTPRGPAPKSPIAAQRCIGATRQEPAPNLGAPCFGPTLMRTPPPRNPLRDWICNLDQAVLGERRTPFKQGASRARQVMSPRRSNARVSTVGVDSQNCKTRDAFLQSLQIDENP